MSQASDRVFADRLDVLRTGLRIMALRALGDPRLTEDVVQETLARVLAAVREGRLRDPEKLGSFARGIARHVISDEIRERGRGASLDVLERAPGPSEIPNENPLETLVRLEAEEQVRGALSKLSPADRELLRLSFFEGLKPAELAGRMGEPATRIRMRKSRALDRLRRAFLEAGPSRYEPRAPPTSNEVTEPSPPAADPGGVETGA